MNEGKPICRVCSGAHVTGECVGDARVNIPAIKRPGTGSEVVNDEESGHAKFFNVPSNPNAQPLSDEDKTPVVASSTNKATKPKANTVTEFDLGDLRARLAASNTEKKGVEASALDLEHVFDDVANNRDAEVVGFIKRAISDLKFENSGQFELFVKDLFGGDNDPVGAWKLEDIKPLHQMSVEMRVQIGGSRPIVEIVLVNERGQGARKGLNVTRVGDVKIQEATGPAVAESVPPPAPKSKKPWALATTLVNMVRGRREK